jgi:hypothetical protein
MALQEVTDPATLEQLNSGGFMGLGRRAGEAIQGGLGRLGGALFPGGSAPPGVDPATAQQQAMLTFGLGLMAGKDRSGSSLAGNIGNAFQQASQSYQGAMDTAFKNSLMKRQEDREERSEDRQEKKEDRASRERVAVTAKRASAGMKGSKDAPAYWQLVAGTPEVQEVMKTYGLEAPSQLDPASWQQFQQQLEAVGTTGAPLIDPAQRDQTADIQNWMFYQNLPPEQRQEWMKLQRQPTAPQLTTINGVPTLVDRITGTQTPLSSLPAELQALLQQSAAKATGTATGEQQGDVLKKGVQAQQGGDILSIAEPLIDASTGSATGAAMDKVAAFFGASLDGAEATAQLQVLQAALMMNQPRMEGPQGEKDVELYQKAAGQIGDPTVPRAQKKAALSVIRKLQEKYIERAQGASGAKGATNGIEALMDKYAPKGQQ